MNDFAEWEREVEPVNVLAVVERAMDEYPWLFPGWAEGEENR